MTSMRRTLGLIAALATAGTALAAGAQEWPNRPIKFIVSLPAGTAPDLTGRVFAQLLAEDVKQNVIVENRAGANGLIAVDAAARAAPDGYTFLVTTGSTLSANPFLYKNGMQAVTGLDPVTRLADNEFVIATHASLGVRTLGDLLKLVRSKPGILNASTSSRGGTANLAAELLKMSADLDFVIVSYTGGAASAAALDRGEVNFTVESLVQVEPLAKAGKATILASLGLKRSARFPDLPTVDEAAFRGFSVNGWVGLMAPKGTPPEIISAVQSKLARAVQNEDVRARLFAIDAAPVVNPPREFAAEWKAERDTWERVIKARNIKID
jgi:tripartite-type tricarboxylate transporter receptor subunit TctC